MRSEMVMNWNVFVSFQVVRHFLPNLHVLPLPPVHLRSLPHWTSGHLRGIHTTLYSLPGSGAHQCGTGTVNFLSFMFTSCM